PEHNVPQSSMLIPPKAESERFIFCLQPVNGNNKQKNTIARFALCLIVLIYRVIPNKNTFFF
ncbi:hypothetical protein OXV63_20630, partial [Bacteroides fragilis]|nr:hypothetical protein [Bacteroides fragilis]